MRLLLVSYFYPPSRDTGGHRPATMAKYLRRLGHEVTVLTTAAYGTGAPDEADVERSFDLQLARARLRGHDRIGSLYDADTYSGRPHPVSKVLVPDPLVAAWAPFAARRALRLHRGRRFDCVITSSPPESAHLTGRALRRRGVPWVVDMRDAWTFEPLRPPFPTFLQRRADERLERRWLGAADAVVCVSRPAAEDLRARLGIEAALVPNGWDPEVAPAPGPAPAVEGGDRRTLVYTGRFGSYGRDPGALVEALKALARSEPDVARRLELVVAGPLTEAEQALLRSVPEPAGVRLTGTLPRERALALQRAADALLLIAHPARSQLLNFKLFEYLASGRPVLALAAGTEAGRVAAGAGCRVVPADDSNAIAGALRELATGGLPAPDPQAVAEHTYPRPAERLAEICQRAVASAR